MKALVVCVALSGMPRGRSAVVGVFRFDCSSAGEEAQHTPLLSLFFFFFTFTIRVLYLLRIGDPIPVHNAIQCIVIPRRIARRKTYDLAI